MRPLVVALVALAAALSQADASGYGGAVVRLPTPAAGGAPVYSPRNGLALTIDARWFDSGGYRPVAVEIEAQAASSSDRVVELELKFPKPNQRGGDIGLTVRQSLLLKAGATSVSGVVRVPGLNEWIAVWWDARVNGSADQSLSLDPQRAVVLAQGGQPVALRLLRIDADVGLPMADARKGQTKVVSSYRGTMIDDAYSPAPADWLDYTSADVVVVDAPVLEGLKESHPERLAALRSWIVAGGTLWIEGVEETPERLSQIDEALRLRRWRFAERRPEDSDAEPPAAAAPPATDAQGNAPDDQPLRGRELGEPIDGAAGWYYPAIARRSRNAREEAERLAERAREEGVLAAVGEALSQRSTTRGWYAQRDAGFGVVAAFAGAPLDAPGAAPGDAVRSVMRQWADRGWSARHGVAPGERSPSFGNLLVEGVGVAPVGAFQVLITLFVLAIGPLNYWLLWRRQQLHLLVLTTPAAAAAVTLALVGYASVADGFGVKARVRSVTLIDQATGEAASWSRVSHFVATTPDAPARMPADTAVIPIRPAWESAIAAEDAQRVMAWSAGSETPGGGWQALSSGWLPARTATQHLLVRSRISPARIDFAEGAGGWRATNRLGAPVSLLLVLGDDGQWRHATDLAEGERVALEPLERLDAVGLLRTQTVANTPTYPIGAGKSVEETLEMLGASRDIRRTQQEMSTYSLSDNLLNAQIAALVGLDGGRALDLPPRSYVAVAPEAVETPLGWPGVEEVGSFHVVAGRW
ncbi:hypothetical protein [Botrimarina sp.]|uniref:hypothetical protein n=1 Tax=Botrimarina sp. TaxID=2795802 RepID=UPI0032EDA5F6